MNESNQRIDLAIKEVVDIPGLGISFGSKHLRFLYPEFCPVLDVNTVKLGYEQTPQGYQKFAQDCRLIANTLTERGTPNPFPERPKKWFVSDIDMALFARLSGWK
ncbi:hypothetical protein [Deinococcus marmoris]|uniref:hypothetical protein n=2 Tax=Deinococcus TaxID=1298 RepID=UPI00158DAC14|nr:hypothetical protein [Deinococcus marmoris]